MTKAKQTYDNQYILGYLNPEDSELTEFESLKEADSSAEEYCIVIASSLEEAKLQYDDQFKAWKERNNPEKVEKPQQIYVIFDHEGDDAEDAELMRGTKEELAQALIQTFLENGEFGGFKMETKEEFNKRKW